MPTILRVGPNRFFFYANDRAEPVHVHVEGGDGTAELSRLQRLVVDHREHLVRAWHAYFKG